MTGASKVRSLTRVMEGMGFRFWRKVQTYLCSIHATYWMKNPPQICCIGDLLQFGYFLTVLIISSLMSRVPSTSKSGLSSRKGFPMPSITLVRERTFEAPAIVDVDESLPIIYIQ